MFSEGHHVKVNLQKHLPIQPGDLSLGTVDAQEVKTILRSVSQDGKHQRLEPEIETGSENHNTNQHSFTDRSFQI